MIIEIAILGSLVAGGAIIMRRMEPADDAEYVEIDQTEPVKTGAFDDEELQAFHIPVDSYEGKHRWDPQFQWETQEEERVVRKIDLRLCPWLCLMFFAFLAERGNICPAPSRDMLDNLQLSVKEYNTGQLIYLSCSIAAALPSQLMSKRFGPDLLLPIQMITWSLIASIASGLQGRNAIWTTQAMIGLCEGGFVPSIVLYLSYFYTSAELPVRLSYLWASYSVVSVLLTLTASVSAHFSGLYNMPTFQWLPGLEGALTCIIGFVSYLYLPPCPTQTRSEFRGEKGWFSAREEKIIANRLLRDDPSKGSMHNLEALSIRMIWNSLTDYHLWPIYLLGLSWNITMVPAGKFFTEILRIMGYNPLQSHLFTVAPYGTWATWLLFFTGAAEWLNERLLLSSLSQVYVIPMLMSLLFLPRDREFTDTYALTLLMVAQPFVHSILAGLASRNSGSVRSRTVSAALYNMCFQASKMIGHTIYRSSDAPFYHEGTKILILLTVYNFVLFLAIKLFFFEVNRKRERLWDSMSIEAKEAYLATTKDEGNKRLDFRFAH